MMGRGRKTTPETLQHAIQRLERIRAQRDQAVAALHVARDFIHTDRMSLADCSTAPDGSIDPDDAEAVADYDNALALIDAAIAKVTSQA